MNMVGFVKKIEQGIDENFTSLKSEYGRAK